MVDNVVTIVIAVFSSGGLWSFLEHCRHKKSSMDKLLLGVAHDRIIQLANNHIRDGFITDDDYITIYEYLYLPYHDAGGNGPVDRKMERVYALPDDKGVQYDRRNKGKH